ncbi:MAG: DUF4411 family protein [Coriobacteriales bacterium]|jgi:hypothetical protein|nr:DUF4411 family protein [Coriobacteriales bacterium]
MNETVYVLDSNIFITPHKTYYRFAFCPGYWDFIRLQFENKNTISIRKVHDEITHNEDKLSDWLKSELNKSLFIDTLKDNKVQTKYEEISSWVLNHVQYTDTAKRVFLAVEEADPWLCAHAAVYGETVVTNETSKPFSKSKISLVDVLDAFGVSHIGIFEYLEAQQAKFVFKSMPKKV